MRMAKRSKPNYLSKTTKVPENEAEEKVKAKFCCNTHHLYSEESLFVPSVPKLSSQHLP